MALVLLVTGAAACAPDETEGVEILGEESVALAHQATLTYRVEGGGGILGRVTVESSAPRQVEVVSVAQHIAGDAATVTVRGVGTGAAELSFYVAGQYLGTRQVAVNQATGVSFVVAGDRFGGVPEIDVGREIVVAAGRPVVLRARFTDAEGRPLAGRGVLHLPTAGGASLLSVQSNAAGDELVLAPTTAGAYVADVHVGETRVEAAVEVTVVTAEAATTLELAGGPGADAAPDAPICYGAVARDAAGRRIHGLPVGWYVGGRPQTVAGTHICFEPAPEAEKETALLAELKGPKARLAVKGDGFEVQESGAASVTAR